MKAICKGKAVVRTVKKQKKNTFGFLWLFVTLPLSGLLILAARKWPGFAQWYAVTVYPVLAQAVNRVTGLAPFSVMEVVCTSLLIVVPVLVVVRIIRLIKALRQKTSGPALRTLGAAALRWLAGASCLLSVFCLFAGINYYRDDFAAVSGLPVQKSTTAEVQALCEELAGAANTLAAAQLRDGEGVAILYRDYRTLAADMDAAYGAAAQRFPCLGGSYGRAKAMYGSGFMSRLELTGVFFPFTMESNVNVAAPQFYTPYTVAHELTHLRGFMREDEANYLGYYVCQCSEDTGIRYSGVMMALIHAGNALAKTDRQAYAALCQSYCEQLRADLEQNNRYWEQYEDTPLAEAAERNNNAYLKANGQQDGTASYGRMVDLLLAQRRADGSLGLEE